MCTLTFFPLADDKFVLTTNRDEQPERKTIPPKEYNHQGITLIYPKDEKAGGTWVGANANGRVASLMNGGKEPHIRKESYRLSRGLVMIELLLAKDVFAFLKSFDFNDIEPFTIVMINPQNESVNAPFKAYELIWDEQELHQRILPWETQIWSSTPLYTRKVHQNRKAWLQKFIEETPQITLEAIWDFHHIAGNGDKATDFIMDRGFIHTKSITQFVNDGRISYLYEDLTENFYKHG